MGYIMLIVEKGEKREFVKNQLKKLDFQVECQYLDSSEIVLSNSEEVFYSDISKILNSDWIILGVDKSFPFEAGAMVMLAKLYKIPIFSYGTMKEAGKRQISFCRELFAKQFCNLQVLIEYLNEINRNHKLQIIHDNYNAEDILSKLEAFDAGYDTGYSETEGFWGSRPAHYVQQAAQNLEKKKNVRCLDLGCGPGKNAVYLSKQGFQVEAMDSSYYAIVQAKSLSDQVKWKIRDVRKWHAEEQIYDLVIMTGLLHCYSSVKEIEFTVSEAQKATLQGGYHVISVFNNGEQDLSGHPANFNPILLPHDFYLNLYNGWEILASSNSILHDEHPNNNIVHKHSITRILARKK